MKILIVIRTIKFSLLVNNKSQSYLKLKAKLQMSREISVFVAQIMCLCATVS